MKKEMDLKEWKNEQINYFKNYLKVFEKNSKEYQIVQKGIKELEDM